MPTRWPDSARPEWSAVGHPLPTATEVSALDATLEAMRYLSADDGVAALESSLHVGYLREQELPLLRTLLPSHLKKQVGRIDRGAQSGFETHVRLRLLELGHDVQTQVLIPGAGHVGMVVDNLRCIETDGRELHSDSFLSDRTRDLVVEGYGIRVLRLAGPHIFDSWGTTLATIRRMLRGALRLTL